MKQLQKINCSHGIKICRFTPSLFHLYWYCYSHNEEPDYWHSTIHKIRLVLMLLNKGYEVIYGEIDNRPFGHIVIDYNANKFSGMKSHDVIIGPKWVVPSQRGKGYGTELLGIVLNEMEINYNNAYEIISENNIASIKCAEKNGYSFFSCAKKNRFGRFELCSNSSWRIYKKSNIH